MFFGIYRGIIVPGFLRWCSTLFQHAGVDPRIRHLTRFLARLAGLCGGDRLPRLFALGAIFADPQAVDFGAGRVGGLV